MCDTLEKAGQSIVLGPGVGQGHFNALDEALEKEQGACGLSWNTAMCDPAQRKCCGFGTKVMLIMSMSSREHLPHREMAMHVEN